MTGDDETTYRWEGERLVPWPDAPPWGKARTDDGSSWVALEFARSELIRGPRRVFVPIGFGGYEDAADPIRDALDAIDERGAPRAWSLEDYTDTKRRRDAVELAALRAAGPPLAASDRDLRELRDDVATLTERVAELERESEARWTERVEASERD